VKQVNIDDIQNYIIQEKIIQSNNYGNLNKQDIMINILRGVA